MQRLCVGVRAQTPFRVRFAQGCCVRGGAAYGLIRSSFNLSFRTSLNDGAGISQGRETIRRRETYV